MEILIALVVGLIVGVFTTYCVMSTAQLKVDLNPNDYTMPEMLPGLEDVDFERGFNITDNVITMHWKHEKFVQNRTWTVKTKPSNEDFQHEWYKQELNFYLKGKPYFEKQDKTDV